MHLWFPIVIATALADPAAYEQHVAAAATSARAEQDGAFAAAYLACREAVDVLPDGPRAPRCLNRLKFLDDRRDDDGTFTAWSTLQKVRRTWRDADPEDARQQVVGLLRREGISLAVKADAVLWLARDAITRRDQPQEAIDLTAPLLVDRASLPEDLRKRLIGTHALALARAGRLAEAKAVESEVAIATPAPRPTPVENEAWRQQRAVLGQVSWATLGAFALLTSPLVVRAFKRPPLPLGLVPLLAILGVVWLLAEAWSHGAGVAIPYLAAGFSLIHLLSAFARSTEAPQAWRTAVSLGAVLATLAVSWLALDATQSLGWVGL